MLIAIMVRNSFIPVRPTLSECDKRGSNEYIESLGLRNCGQDYASPSFHAEEVKSLYNAVQARALSTAKSMSPSALKTAFERTDFLQSEVQKLIAEYGNKVWGMKRGHLIDANLHGTELYPQDLRI